MACRGAVCNGMAQDVMRHPSDRLSDPAAVAIAHAILARESGPATLDSWSSKVLLAAYGVPISRERMVRNRITAVEAATEEVGFPCVLESGAVTRSGLRDAAAVAVAYDEMSEIAGFSGAWLRETVPAGISVRIRASFDKGGLSLDCDSGSLPALADLLTRIAELAQDLCDVIAAIELDPVIVLPDRIVALRASITTRRGNP